MAKDDIVTFIPANGYDGEDTAKTAHDEHTEHLSEQLGDLNQYASIRVYRCNVGSQNADSYCEAFPADKYDLPSLMEHLRVSWGAGDYRIHLYKSGKKGIAQNKLLSITPRLNSTPTVTVPDFKGELGQAFQGLAQVILQSQQQQAQMLAQVLAKPAADPHQQMLQQFELMKGLRDAMGIQATSQPQLNTTQDPFAAMGNMMSGLAGLVTAAKTLLPELGINIGGVASDDNDSLIGLAKTVLPQIAGLVSNHQKIEAAKVTTNGAIVAQQAVRRHAKNPAPRPPVNVPRETNLQNAQTVPPKPILQEQALTLLMQYAANDTDTDEVAKNALPHLDESIKKIIVSDTAFRQFVKAHPDILDYPDWWLDLLYTLQDCLINDTVPETVNTVSDNAHTTIENATNR